MTRKAKATLVIGICASAAAAWSAGTAAIPVAGPLLADTAGLTAISVAMAYLLCVVYDKSVDVAYLASFATIVIGRILGEVGLKILASFVPFFGSYVNAGITAVLHTAIGLVICELFEEGRDLNSISRKEFSSKVKDKKAEAETERNRYDEMFKSLSPTDQKRIMELQATKLKDSVTELKKDISKKKDISTENLRRMGDLNKDLEDILKDIE